MLRLHRPSLTATLLCVGWVVFCGWFLAAWLSVQGLEEPSYEVIGQRDGYEMRKYGPMLAATVSVAAPWSQAYAQGSALLSAYVEGDNRTSEGGAPIAQSVPVLATQTGTSWLVSFLVPSRWTEVTLPRPNDPRISVVRIARRTVAVVSFSGGAGRDRASRAEERLREFLARDRIVTIGAAMVAQYHPSWAPPFLRRNEIIIPIRP